MYNAANVGKKMEKAIDEMNTIYKSRILMEFTLLGKKKDSKNGLVAFDDPYTECTIKDEETGELFFYCKMSEEKWKNTPTPARDFFDWLADNKPKSGCDVCRDCRDCSHFIWQRRLETLYFKEKPFYVFLKELFLRIKAAAGMKIKSRHLHGKVNNATQEFF